MKSLRQFDLNLLIIFEALISECHVSRAAEKVFLSQSAMSHALNRLRDQLDDPLLVRTENGLQATPKAAAMLPEIRKALQLVERSLSPPEAFQPQNSERRFTIASTDYFETVIFPQLLSHLQQIAPGIGIDIQMISEQNTRQQLESREVDLIVGIDAARRVPSPLIKTPWVSEQQVCLTGSNNLRVGDALTLEAYIQQPHVVFSDLAGETASTVDNWLAGQQLQRLQISRTVNYMAAARIVAMTDAIMTLPYHMALLFTQMLPVRLVTPPESIPQLEMVTLHHPLFSNDPALQWLLQQVQAFGQQVVANTD